MNPSEGALDPLGDPKDGHLLTRAIIDTIREPFIILDEDLRIVVANQSFYKKFDLTQQDTQEKMFYDIGNGEWNIPALRTLLEEVIPKHTTVEEYEMEHDFISLGVRTMVVNAREIHYENGRKKMLLSIFDITYQRILETERERLITQKDLLLKEMGHRIANSLQLIASILLLKADEIDSKEGKAELEDAHERILAIATIQRQLDSGGTDEQISVGDYLTGLCKSLSHSMIGGRKPITLEVKADVGCVPSDVAVSFGLLTTELVINSIKHAFPNGRSGTILVHYRAVGSGWILSIEDNGIGKSEVKAKGESGLGTSIMGALANQLHASIRIEHSALGRKVSIVHSGI